ncbi:MAG: ribonuclease D [Aeromonadaceae bacterium]|nr:ribonuclease D [Aeromonadaceae bacterium]
MEYQIITSTQALQAYCAGLTAGPLFVDTEFVRTRSFYPKLGLFQVFDGRQLALVDPLSGADLSPLWQRLLSSQDPVVLYAASEDLEVILQQAGALPARLHDAQLAAAFCGHGMSVGFNAMTQALLQVTLAKEQARTDWLARPLTPEQLMYAAADVHYLQPLYADLMTQVSALGRQAWFEEECQELMARKQERGEPALAYREIGNAWLLGSKQLAVLQRLAAWREAEARHRDLALNFVVKEAHLFAVAQQLPTQLRQLEGLGLLPSEIRTHGRTLLRLVQEGVQSDPAQWPARLERLVDHPHYKRELKRIKAKVELVAQDQRLPAEFIASKKIIHQYLTWLWLLSDEERGQSTPRILRGWRQQLLGSLAD